MTIIDDAVIRVGSTNLNNRSFGFDTECDVAAAPMTEDGRAAITRYRHRTMGHWIGVTTDEFAAAEALTRSPGQAVQRFDTGRMKLLGATPPTRLDQMIAEFQLGDPTSVSDVFRPWKRRVRSQHRAIRNF
jgi:hypothetical protein